TNPVQGVRLPIKVNNTRLRYLTPQEIGHLLAVSPLHLKRIALTALHTGMRKSEILKLRWEQIDLDQCLLLLSKNKSGELTGLPLNTTMTSLFKEIKMKQEQLALNSP